MENSTLISKSYVQNKLGLESVLYKHLISLIFKIFKINELNSLFLNVKELYGYEFVSKLLSLQQVELAYTNIQSLNSKDIKTKGVIVVANHPHGILDGLGVIKVLSEKVGNLKLVVNRELAPITQLSDLFLLVERKTALKSHRSKYFDGKRILNSICSENNIVFFPAGSVSHFDFKKCEVLDKTWDSTCIKLILKSKKPIVPLYIEGRNSFFYHFFYYLNKPVSFLWLISEFLRKKKYKLCLHFGEPVYSEQFNFEDFEKYFKDIIYNKLPRSM